MVTRQQAQQQAAYQAQLAARRAQYPSCADTGYMPPEHCYAPVNMGARRRIFAHAPVNMGARRRVFA